MIQMSLSSINSSEHPASNLQNVKILPGKLVSSRWFEVEVQLSNLDEGEKGFNITEYDKYVKSRCKLKKSKVPPNGQDSGDSETSSSVKCPYCPDLFKVRVGLMGSHSLRQHLESDHVDMTAFGEFKDIMSEAVKCGHCNKSYSSKKTLRVHKMQVHDKTSILEACHICGKSFQKGSSTHFGHIRTHKDVIYETCHICSKSFKKGSWTLWGHIRTHKDATYECDVCGARFREGSYLKRHVKCHDLNNKLYKCDICGKKILSPLYHETA